MRSLQIPGHKVEVGHVLGLRVGQVDLVLPDLVEGDLQLVQEVLGDLGVPADDLDEVGEGAADILEGQRGRLQGRLLLGSRVTVGLESGGGVTSEVGGELVVLPGVLLLRHGDAV